MKWFKNTLGWKILPNSLLRIFIQVAAGLTNKSDLIFNKSEELKLFFS